MWRASVLTLFPEMFPGSLGISLAGKALDVTDPDIGLTIRFTAESLYWVVLIVPIASIFLGYWVGRHGNSSAVR